MRLQLGLREGAALGAFALTAVVLLVSNSDTELAAVVRAKTGGWEAWEAWTEMKVQEELVQIPFFLQLSIRIDHPDGVALSTMKKVALVHLADDSIHSVTLKTLLPPSGDPHDYLSLSRYYWPPEVLDNENTPWIRQIGQLNPATNDVGDFALFRKTVIAVNSLSLAYQHRTTPDELEYAYRSKAIFRLREFFCHSKTRMNPNLLFGSVIRNAPSKDATGTEWEGIPSVGTKEGILDLWPLAVLFPSIAALEVDITTQECLESWGTDYLSFLSTSPIALAARETNNIHAVRYDSQRVGLLLFLKRDEEARHYLRQTTIPRLQVPFRLNERTSRKAAGKLWSNSFAIVRAWAFLASQAQTVEVDVWGFREEAYEPPILQTALTLLLEFAFGQASPTLLIRPEHWPLLFHAEKEYRIWEKDDELSRKWQGWLLKIQNLAALRVEGTTPVREEAAPLPEAAPEAGGELS